MKKSQRKKLVNICAKLKVIEIKMLSLKYTLEEADSCGSEGDMNLAAIKIIDNSVDKTSSIVDDLMEAK